ncbi:hypothetical protein PN480_04785 [Dolichospermum circinale CS-1225]|nr:hypothetical protein [Dolichospermum circinale]MDB9521271.1 hypothetical protein [Dolichospermum circinale CS-1225]
MILTERDRFLKLFLNSELLAAAQRLRTSSTSSKSDTFGKLR